MYYALVIPARVHHYRDPAAVSIGLGELSARGLVPRGILFIALDSRGECLVAVPDDLDVVSRLRVGEKMCLKAPWEGRYFHFDAIHRLPGDTVLWNGDRRLGDAGSASEVACAVAHWMKQQGTKSVFLGCSPHQSGSWWAASERSPVIDLHATGLAGTVVTQSGLLARRLGESRLYHLDFAQLREGGARAGWSEVYDSPMGNVLMLESRVMNYSLVLSCERGLVEIDVSGLPDQVTEIGRVPVEAGIGVVGRIDGGAFAVTTGKVEPWGLANVTPALLVGSSNQALRDLPTALRAAMK